MRGRFLRTVTALVFLGIGAYLIAAFARSMTAPETVTARRVSVTDTLFAEGRILRDEVYLDCPYDTECFTVAEGQRVSAGALIYSDGDGDSYYSPCGGFFAGDRIVRNGWYFETDIEDTDRLYEGRSISLVFLGNTHPAVVESVDGKRVLIRCREGLGDVLYLDTAEAELNLGTVTGTAVPEASVFFEDGESCVYVLRAGIPKKQSVNIICKTDGEYILSQNDLGVGTEILKEKPSEI